MAFEFHLPDLAEGMTEAEVVSWKVKEGDVVALDQPIVEVMSDKATVEIPSPKAGKVMKLNYDAGDICAVGEVLFVIDEGGSSAGVPLVEDTSAVDEWEDDGAKTAIFDAADVAGMVAKKPVVIDATVDRARTLATPATRRLARQLDIELANVPGTGRNGRVTSDDVRAFAAGGGTPRAMAKTQVITKASPMVQQVREPISIADTGAETRIPLRGMRKMISENMHRSVSTAAHFTYVEEVDTTDLVEVRGRAKERAAERGIKLTYLPFIIKAVVAGLKKWPALNSSLDEAAQEIVRKNYYNIGVATQGPNGLAVTVVRDADKLSVFQIAEEIQRLATAVQEGKATREDLTGSTFTISSLGKLGGLHATPIINFPEVGILGVHKMEQRPAVVNNEIVARWRMNLAISLDHRIVDGWDGAMFVQDVKSLLEDPTLMFMEMV